MTDGNLLDVNFLVALAWPNHISHEKARGWFTQNSGKPFATCPITESGFIRISMNPLVVTEQVSFNAALELLGRYRTNYPHLFWSDDLPLEEALAPFQHITGHRQITDAYLLALAVSHQGFLVTLDGAISGLAPPTYREHLVVVGQTP